MARPTNSVPTKPYKIYIPVDLAAPMELELHSELEGRIPHGKLSGYICDLIRADQKSRKSAGGHNGN